MKSETGYQVLSGVFYYELEHSLDNFKIKYYTNYKDVLIDSLIDAIKYFKVKKGRYNNAGYKFIVHK